MSRTRKRSYVQRTVFVAWAMLTLVLLFCIALLVREMVRREQVAKDQTRPVPLFPTPAISKSPPRSELESREIHLFFATPDGSALEIEPRNIPHGPYTADNCRRALEELARGPRAGLYPIMPPSVELRAVYLLEDGVLVVDFSRELLLDLEKQTSVAVEALLVYGIAATVTQPALRGSRDVPPTRLRILVEGAQPHKSFETHLDMSGLIAPDANWFATPLEAVGDDA